jgi:hypothetical protein
MKWRTGEPDGVGEPRLTSDWLTVSAFKNS